MTLGDARYVYVRYVDRGRTIHDEVLCRRCYEEMSARGVFDARHFRRGQHVEITPWHSEPRCSGCDEATGEDVRAVTP